MSLQRRSLLKLFLLITAGVWLGAPALLGAPAAPRTLTLTQADGSRFLAQTFGDEWHNGLQTLDQHPIVFDAFSNNWVYARLDASGRWAPTAAIVGRDAAPILSVMENRLAPARERARLSAGNAMAPSAARAPVTGKLPVLVLLASFTDQPPVGTNADYWRRLFFGSTPSVRDYYREVSYGKLELVPAKETHGTVNDGIVGWIRLPYTHPDTGDEVNVLNEQLAEHMIIFVDKYVDFQVFDKNGDGNLSRDELAIVFVIAGYEVSFATGGASCGPGVWAHSWALGIEIEAPVQDGVRIGDAEHRGAYVQVGEWHCTAEEEPGHAATIGVIAHEVGHLLGAPDLYDPDGTSQGVGDWDLMGTGAWLGLAKPGDRPVHPSAWTKYLWGWIAPQPVTESIQSAKLEQVETWPEDVYRFLDNPGGVDWHSENEPGRGEYFLVENRQKIGYDAALPEAGLLIWHVDESQPDNTDERRRLLDLVEASDVQELDCICKQNTGDAADPFPGTTGKRAWDDQTLPSSRLHSGLPSRIAIQKISDSGAVMTADFFVLATRPGDPAWLFDENFEHSSEGWVGSAEVQRTSAHCDGGASRRLIIESHSHSTSDMADKSPTSTNRVWYFGDPEACFYSLAGQLISPARPLAAEMTRLKITFSHYLALNPRDRGELWLSFDGGTRWRRVWQGRAGRELQWRTITLMAGIPRGSASLRLKFVLVRHARSTGGIGWLIDDVKVLAGSPVKKKKAALPPPASFLELDGTRLLNVSVKSVQLEVFGLDGRLRYRSPSESGPTLRWHYQDNDGNPLPNGVYLYVLRARDSAGQILISRAQKLVIVR